MSIENIGIIGRGFVGGSIEKLMRFRGRPVEAFDAKDGDPEEGYSRVVSHSNLIYVAVPTPMDENGKCHTDIIRNSLSLIDKYCECHKKDPLVFIKSTMSPGTSDGLKSEFTKLRIITNPEFLTERNAYEDLKNSSSHIIGLSDRQLCPILYRFHRDVWPESSCMFVSNTQAELIKYLINNYLAVRVAFANQYYQLCEALNVDYQSTIDVAKFHDKRIGGSHWQVPGIDGELGFGGKCFPKDLNGMIALFKELGVDCPLLEAAWDYNLQIRSDKDWERIEGATTN